MEHSVRFELTWSLRSPGLQPGTFNRSATSALKRRSQKRYERIDELVGANGFEPLTSAVSGQRSAN